MDLLDRLREKLFGGPELSTGRLYQGSLIRPSRWDAEHTDWLAHGRTDRMLRGLRRRLQDERLSGTGDLHLLQTPQAVGLQLMRPASATADDLRHLMDLWRDRVLAEGYRVQNSDLRLGVDGSARERHYLKPLITAANVQGTMDQRYGNVLLEAFGPTDDLHHLRVLVTVYSDRNYTPALPAAPLLDRLLEAPRRALS
jgi:hypothetical protein